MDSDHIQLYVINILHLWQDFRRCREGTTWDLLKRWKTYWGLYSEPGVDWRIGETYIPPHLSKQKNILIEEGYTFASQPQDSMATATPYK